MRAKAWIACGVCVVIAGSCTPKGTPTLELTLSPKNVSDATPVQVRVVATNGEGKVGSGSVKISSAQGSLTTPVSVQLDAFGTATAELICDRSMEPDCAQPVRVVAEWTSDDVVVTAEARLNSGGANTGGGAGGGGGSAPPPWAGGLVLFGSLAEGSTARYTLAPLLAPRESRAGFSNTAPSFALAVDRAGSVIYKSALKTFRWVEDPFEIVYPLNAQANDLEIAVPCPTFGFSLSLRPDTESRVWTCEDGTMFENGAVITLAASATPPVYRVVAGANGSFLRWDAGGFTLFDAAGTATQITVPVDASLQLERAVVDGFLFVEKLNCSLFRLSLTGTLTKVGDYGPMPNDIALEPQFCWTGSSLRAMTSDGLLLVRGVRTPGPIDDVVIQMSPNGAMSQVVYDETSFRDAGAGRPPTFIDTNATLLAP